MAEDPKPGKVDIPRGLHKARVDEKGRLKLPAEIQKYLTSLSETKVWVTTVDESTARVYPLSIWEENERLLETSTADPAAMESVSFLANYYGAETEVDGQGRVLLHPELRRPLGLENQTVFLSYYKGRIDVRSEATINALKARALDDIGGKIVSAEKIGFK